MQKYSSLDGHQSRVVSRAEQVTTPQQERASSSNSKHVVPAEESSAVAEVLENTLWNRQLGAMSEEIVAALVCQIFEGEPKRCFLVVRGRPWKLAGGKLGTHREAS